MYVYNDQYQKDGYHLREGFPFRQNMGNNRLPYLQGKYAIGGNNAIPYCNHPNHPGHYVVQNGESDQRRGYQHFIGQRIHELAQAGNYPEFSGIPAIVPIGNSCNGKYCRCQHLLKWLRFQDQKNKQGGQQYA